MVFELKYIFFLSGFFFLYFIFLFNFERACPCAALFHCFQNYMQGMHCILVYVLAAGHVTGFHCSGPLHYGTQCSSSTGQLDTGDFPGSSTPSG